MAQIINKIQAYDRKTEEYKTYEIGGWFTIVTKRGFARKLRQVTTKYKILNIIQEHQQVSPKEWQKYGLVVGGNKYNGYGKLVVHAPRFVVTGRAIFN